MDGAELELLTETFRKTMTTTPSGAALDAALTDLGWRDLLSEYPEPAIRMVFGLLGETGTHASLLNDVMGGGTPALPYAGGAWVVWSPSGPATTLDPELPLRTVPSGKPLPLAAGHRALGWWLLGTGRTMLALARIHALDRAQFGRPLAAFQAVRHRLAETLVALEGAEATLIAATDPFGSLLAKAAAGEAALTAARHCQQVLGGIGFTAEHPLHGNVRRALVLDGLLGSARELTREAGARLRAAGAAPRLVHL
ncbi:acyl-CoA dehydrogenase family protein [Streptomyces sp. WM6386]|uniref:acyl-CoA dehydrogenase family protein n=1 Tax=Streptomyces sp. WM6386 TaxID=1415558 RepID=UPI000619CE9D|nr:acyl-CoA dehydrogenase family protein [Streptomyces sp. WM6386]KKD07811.1 acyl-CoA dehydrogenase [Streptomyces sp. WM6386]